MLGKIKMCLLLCFYHTFSRPNKKYKRIDQYQKFRFPKGKTFYSKWEFALVISREKCQCSWSLQSISTKLSPSRCLKGQWRLLWGLFKVSKIWFLFMFPEKAIDVNLFLSQQVHDEANLRTSVCGHRFVSFFLNICHRDVCHASLSLFIWSKL